MKKITFGLSLIFTLLLSVVSYAANVGREINSKCRQNLKLLNSGTEKLIKSNTAFNIPKWCSYKQAIKDFLYPDKYLEGKSIVGPTPSCEYYLVSNDKNEYQWLCYLHGVNEGDKTMSFRYHEHQLQGKINSKFATNEEYKKHMQSMLHWTEYTPTPKEFIIYHYNMNPIVTTVITVSLILLSIYLIKSFFNL